MKIKSISWTNYRALPDGKFVPNGSDIVISGRNGSGKSSIAGILPFVLFGDNATTIKRFDDGLLPTDDGLIHAAQIVFDDGTALRREYFWTKTGNRHRLYIDAKVVKANEFAAKIEVITRGGGKLLFNPFAFCELKHDEQRATLMKIFGRTIAIDLPNPIPDGADEDKFIADTKRKLDRLKAEAATFAPAIDELARQITDVPEDLSAAINSATSELDAAKHHRQQILDAPHCDAQLSAAQKRALDVRSAINLHQNRLARLQSERKNLLTDYHGVKNSVGTCPTCSQPLPASLREKHLADIVARGKKITDEIATDENALRIYNDELSELNAKIAELTEQMPPTDQPNRLDLLNAIDQKISDITAQLTKLKSAEKIRARIDELINREHAINRDIAALEHQLTEAKNFRHEKIARIEDAINSHFVSVKFKLFDFAIVSGEAKPTCEATLHGVPYSSLSKGERLRAALDIFIALQKHFDVQLPLIIDDAESYTPNSFIDLPNQKFFFRVTDDDLNISERSVAS